MIIYMYNIDMIRVCPTIRELHPIHCHFDGHHDDLLLTFWVITILIFRQTHMVLVKPIISHFLKRVWEIGYGIAVFTTAKLVCSEGDPEPSIQAISSKYYHPVFPLADLTGWCPCRFWLNMVIFHSYVIATSHCHRVMYPNTTYFRLKN